MRHVLVALSAIGVGMLLIGPATAADEKDEVKEGLVAQVYDIGDAIEDFPDVPADRKPAVKKVDKTINVDSTTENWPGTELSEHFFIRWTGSLKVAKAGKYKLFVESDDGSRLFVDGKKVVNNPGIHGMFEIAAEVELKEGDHEIKLEMFENEGETGCKLSWSGPGIEKQIIPASALSHKKSAE
jgi:hypothetical protein